MSIEIEVVAAGPPGPKGNTGSQGPKGDKGDKGDTGDLANLDIGTVTTGSPAAAELDGNFEDGYTLDLVLPSVGAGSILDEDINAAADIDPTKIAGTAVTQADTGTVTSTMLADDVRTLSPRGGQRPTLERRPTLTIDQMWPNATADFRVVWADSPTLFAVGGDTVLRKSTDSGITWTKKYYPGGLGSLAFGGLFFKTAAGSLITTYHPFDLTAPKIIRSADDGVTWADVVAAQTDVGYLGPTSIAQDPDTAYLYLTEYVTATAAAKATWKISRSTDDGATWATFHTFERDAVAFPDTAVRHGHAVQWDPVDETMWFLCGDGEQAAGLYRLNFDGSDVEPALVRSQLTGKFSAGAVGVMFFPNYIAWGNDQRADHGLIRVARSELGSANPAVELVAEMQSTGFYTVRTSADHDEWLMTVSNEPGSGDALSLDNAFHVYRVADDAATVDELLTVASSTDDSSFAWIYPVPGPDVPLGTGSPVWMAVAQSSPVMPFIGDKSATSFRARLAWGGQSLTRPDALVRRPHYEPVTVSSGYVSLPGLRKQVFAVTEAPVAASSLYILEATREQFVGQGFAYLEVCSFTQGTLNATLGTGLAVDAGADTVTKIAHGLAVDTPVRFAAVGGGVAGVNLYQTYYIATRTDDAFTVAETPGGAVIDITTGGTATITYDPLPVFTVLNAEATTPAMQWMNRSRKSALNEASTPWIMRSAKLSPGTKIAFRLNNVSTPGIAEAVATVTYAWGFL